MDRAREVTLFAAACVLAPSCKEAPPPLGEAVVVVDTDAPVPALAARLRVDFYTEGGEWFESRDVAAPDRSSWPISFSVFTPDEEKAHSVLVRLRAYPEGKTRDYRGERFAQRGRSAAEPVDKRLVVSGVDVTPNVEPQPLLAIDRIVRIVLEPGRVGSARIVLRGACFGTMAELVTGASCIDTEDVRAPADPISLDPDLAVPHESVAGAWGKEQPCTGVPRADEVCVPGGAFVFGNAYEYGVGENSGVPERIALVNAFYMDRYELTVARWRSAYVADKASFGAGHVVLNEQPLATDATSELDERLCSASDADLGREGFALTCVTWEAARALCRRNGGDLPTEAQWEYAAQYVGRPAKTQFPWGDEAVTCDRAVYARFAGGKAARNACKAKGYGPLPVRAAEHEAGDVTPLGIVGMGGGASELMRDAFFGYDSACWMAAGLRDPSCPPDAGERRPTRGGDWTTNAVGVGSQARRRAENVTSYAPALGLRCVRGGG